jgi:O-acetyl-ADP-ribose deacetylase (regulator of RNase III)
MILTEKTGDLLTEAEQGNVDIIVHQANLEHTFGAGIARAIREKFPYAFEADKRTSFCDPAKLGTFSVGANGGVGPVVINLYSQTSLYPSHTSYDAIYEGLSDLRERLEFAFPDIQKRIGFPYQMGSGLADGNWSVVKAIILAVFEDSQFEVVIVKLPNA